MDQFLGYCQATTGVEALILGSCQIGALVGSTIVNVTARRQQLQELFGGAPVEDEAPPQDPNHVVYEGIRYENFGLYKLIGKSFPYEIFLSQ